jgi:DNA-binding transcriptional LysR family regulator
MDRFDAMLAFARVAETRSFTQAAQTLHMSKTAVTQHVQWLEARLRVKLLHRTTRKVNVTADGAAYYERVVRLLADLDDAESGISSASAIPRGRLRVDVPSPMARLVLVPALPEFHARYPDIQLHMGVSDREVDLIGENVDCVLRGGKPADPSLIARHVADLRIGLYAAPSYLESAGVPTHPQQLEKAPHRIVGFLGSRTGRIRAFDMECGHEKLKVAGRHAVALDDGNAYLAAGLAGLGVVWLPHYMAIAHQREGALRPLLTDWSIEPMPLYLAYPPNRHVGARIRVFMDWVTEVVTANAVNPG